VDVIDVDVLVVLRGDVVGGVVEGGKAGGGEAGGGEGRGGEDGVSPPPPPAPPLVLEVTVLVDAVVVERVDVIPSVVEGKGM
jgi:hypothetical protein